MTAPNTYVLGQVVQLKDLISDPVTTLPVADASELVTVYKPDGTTAVPAITPGVTGTYTAQVTPDQTGWWEYVFLSTGLGAGAGRGRFYVSPVP